MSSALSDAVREIAKGLGSTAEPPRYECPDCKDTGWRFVEGPRETFHGYVRRCEHTKGGRKPKTYGFPERVPLAAWERLKAPGAQAWAVNAQPGSWAHLVCDSPRKVDAVGLRVADTLDRRGFGAVRYVDAWRAPTQQNEPWEAYRYPSPTVIVGSIDERLSPGKVSHVCNLLARLQGRTVVLLGCDLTNLRWWSWDSLRQCIRAVHPTEITL